MSLTERAICELYARVGNLEQSPDVFYELLHPQVKWVTKWWIGRGSVEIELELNNIWSSDKKGLSDVTLVTGHETDGGEYADCTALVPLREPDKHDLRTYFETDGQRITRIFTDFLWLDRTWPYPERAKHKLAELILQGVPIAASWKEEERKKLVWPDDGSTPDDEKACENEARLRRTRQAMAEALDADPEGAAIPPLGRG